LVDITLKTRLEGDEDTLIMAVRWLVENKLLKKKGLWTEIIVDDYDGNYAETIFNPRSWKDEECIQGTIKFGFEAREKLELPQEVDFSAELTEIETPKKRYTYEGVKIILHKPMNRVFLIKGLETEEFRVYKANEV